MVLPNLDVNQAQNLAQTFQHTAGAPINISYGGGSAGNSLVPGAGETSQWLLGLAIAAGVSALAFVGMAFRKNRKGE